MLTEGEQLIEALKKGEVDAVISRDQLFFLRLAKVEEELLRSKALLEERVREGAEHLRTLTTELTLTEQRERHRIAELLHGHVQQLLVALNLKIAVMKRRAASPQDHADLSAMHSLVEESIKATRMLSVDLAPPIVGVRGLWPALEWLADWMQEKHELQVTLTVSDQAVCEQEHVAVLLFQSVRELLFNVVKHAGIKCAAVVADVTDDGRLRVTVSDHGVGFDPSATVSGSGLARICERLTLLGGEFRVQSEPGKGSRCVLVAGLPR